MRLPDPPPMSTRVAADEPITVALLAAVAGQPPDLAEQVHAAWLRVARLVAADDAIVVFDEFVLGRPDPLLREVAHQLRLTRRAEARGDFGDEEARFYEFHEDDDAFYEPPTHADRVIAALRHLPDSNRLLDAGRFGRMVWALSGFDRSTLIPHIELERAMERLVLALADAIHFDGAVVSDAGLPGERVDRLRRTA